MTLPPCFPSAVAPMENANSPTLKPRLSSEDEDIAHLLLDMSQIATKELQYEEVVQEDVASASSTLDSMSTHEDSNSQDSIPESSNSQESIPEASNEATKETGVESSWNPTRTVSIDEESSSSPPPPVEFINFPYSAPSGTTHPLKTSFNTNHQTPTVAASFQQHIQRMLHRPAVITPIRTFSRPIVSVPPNVSPMMNRPPYPPSLTTTPSHSLWKYESTLNGYLLPRTESASSPPTHPQMLDIPQGFPKLPPLLSMKRDKRMNRLRMINTCNSSSSEESHDSVECEDQQQRTTSPLPQKEETEVQELASTPSTPKQKLKTKGKIIRKNGKKFSWKNYPELEEFLISNRPEYLRHSAQNYTLEQKDYNNTLTARLIEFAEECGYGNLLERPEYHQDFGSFTAVRDRIRGYYKSYLQSSRRREQRRQRRLEKQRQQLQQL